MVGFDPLKSRADRDAYAGVGRIGPLWIARLMQFRLLKNVDKEENKHAATSSPRPAAALLSFA